MDLVLNPRQCLILLEMTKTNKVIKADTWIREHKYQMVTLKKFYESEMKIDRKDVKYIFKLGLLTRLIYGKQVSIYEVYWPQVMLLPYDIFREVQTQHSLGTL